MNDSKQTTIIHKVEIKTCQDGGDPSRVARAVKQVIKEMARGITNQCCKCDEVYEYADPTMGFICWGCKNS